MVKNPPANAGNRFDPWIRKIPWRRTWQPTPVLLLGKFHGWRSGATKSQTRLSGFTLTLSLQILVRLTDITLHVILNLTIIIISIVLDLRIIVTSLLVHSSIYTSYTKLCIQFFNKEPSQKGTLKVTVKSLKFNLRSLSSRHF